MLHGLIVYHKQAKDITCKCSWRKKHKNRLASVLERLLSEVTFDGRVSRSDTILVADHSCVY